MSEARREDWVDFGRVKTEVSFERVLAKLGLLAGMEKRGEEVVGICPFHGGEKKSFCVNVSKGVFQCFGCKRKGNVLDFVSQYQEVSVKEAGKWLMELLEEDKKETATQIVVGEELRRSVERVVSALLLVVVERKDEMAKKIVDAVMELLQEEERRRE
jgi:DNA primase